MAAALAGRRASAGTTRATSLKIELAATTASNAGVIQQAGNPLLHTYGTHNLFICTNAGNFALTGTENVGIGNLALLSVASGGNNVPIGYAAAVSLTLRIGNFALGSQALANNIDANANVAIGYLALNGLTGGSGANIAVGQQAGYQLSTGANNVLFGTGAGAGITTGSNNIIIGPLGGLSSTLASTVIIAPGGTERTRINSSAHTTFQGAVAPKSYTVATVPSAGAAGAGAMIYVSDESGGAVPLRRVRLAACIGSRGHREADGLFEIKLLGSGDRVPCGPRQSIRKASSIDESPQVAELFVSAS